jgi:hypothetical protein
MAPNQSPLANLFVEEYIGEFPEKALRNTWKKGQTVQVGKTIIRA